MISAHAASIREAAAERQRDELMLIAGTPRGSRGLSLMEELGLLSHVLPELNITRGVEQPKEHHWDVFGHSLATVAQLDIVLADDEPSGAPSASLWRELWRRLEWWDGAREHFREILAPGSTRGAVVKFAGLLHDIGKPATKSFDETGRMRFFGHSEAGAEIAGRLMRRLRFSTRETALAQAMIEAHLRPVQMAQQGPPSDRAIYKYFRDTGEAGIDTLFLSLADHLAAVGPRFSLAGWGRHVEAVSYILAKRLKEAVVVRPPRLIRGDELMADLGLAAGPDVGRVLEVIREAQAAGEVTTREEALDTAREYLRENARKREIG
jgi:poly(A) polymerase